MELSLIWINIVRMDTTVSRVPFVSTATSKALIWFGSTGQAGQGNLWFILACQSDILGWSDQ